MPVYGYLAHSELYHHGVKGMKWGIRKQKAKRIISNIKTFTKSKHGKRALATGAAIGATTGAAIGTMIGVSKLKQKKDMEKLRAADAEEWLRRNGMLFEPDYFEYDKFQHSALMHHGVKGMKWGIRRYQNENGTLTPEGMKRYRVNMYSHSGNRIYSPMGANAKKKRWSNQANSFKGGEVYNDFQRELYRGLKKDYKNSLKNGYITKDEYRKGLKTTRKATKQIAEQRLGSTAKKYGKVARAVNIASMAIPAAAAGTLIGHGIHNEIKYNKEQNRRAGEQVGYGSYREMDDNGKYGRWKSSIKENRKHLKKQGLQFAER